MAILYFNLVGFRTILLFSKTYMQHLIEFQHSRAMHGWVIDYLEYFQPVCEATNFPRDLRGAWTDNVKALKRTCIDHSYDVLGFRYVSPFRDKSEFKTKFRTFDSLKVARGWRHVFVNSSSRSVYDPKSGIHLMGPLHGPGDYKPAKKFNNTIESLWHMSDGRNCVNDQSLIIYNRFPLYSVKGENQS